MEIRDRLTPDAFADPGLRHRARAICDTVTITTVLAGTDMSVFDVVASADGDAAATIVHGLGAAPLEVQLLPMLSLALTALPMWAAPLATIDATNVVLAKLTSTGSGSATKQLRVICKRPHSIGK